MPFERSHFILYILVGHIAVSIDSAPVVNLPGLQGRCFNYPQDLNQTKVGSYCTDVGVLPGKVFFEPITAEQGGFLFKYDVNTFDDMERTIGETFEFIDLVGAAFLSSTCSVAFKKNLCGFFLPPCFEDAATGIQAPQLQCQPTCQELYSVCDFSFQPEISPACDAYIREGDQNGAGSYSKWVGLWENQTIPVFPEDGQGYSIDSHFVPCANFPLLTNASNSAKSCMEDSTTQCPLGLVKIERKKSECICELPCPFPLWNSDLDANEAIWANIQAPFIFCGFVSLPFLLMIAIHEALLLGNVRNRYFKAYRHGNVPLLKMALCGIVYIFVSPVLSASKGTDMICNGEVSVVTSGYRSLVTNEGVACQVSKLAPFVLQAFAGCSIQVMVKLAEQLEVRGLHSRTSRLQSIYHLQTRDVLSSNLFCLGIPVLFATISHFIQVPTGDALAKALENGRSPSSQSKQDPGYYATKMGDHIRNHFTCFMRFEYIYQEVLLVYLPFFVFILCALSIAGKISFKTVDVMNEIKERSKDAQHTRRNSVARIALVASKKTSSFTRSLTSKTLKTIGLSRIERILLNKTESEKMSAFHRLLSLMVQFGMICMFCVIIYTISVLSFLPSADSLSVALGNWFDCKTTGGFASCVELEKEKIGNFDGLDDADAIVEKCNMKAIPPKDRELLCQLDNSELSQVQLSFMFVSPVLLPLFFGILFSWPVTLLLVRLLIYFISTTVTRGSVQSSSSDFETATDSKVAPKESSVWQTALD